MTTACKELISTNMTLWHNKTRPPNELRDITCPSLCSGQGTCRNGTCVCNSGFISADCSIDSNKGPNITSIANGGLCDIRNQRDCSKVRIIGSDFMDSNFLSCRTTEIEVCRISGTIKICFTEKQDKKCKDCDDSHVHFSSDNTSYQSRGNPCLRQI